MHERAFARHTIARGHGRGPGCDLRESLDGQAWHGRWFLGRQPRCCLPSATPLAPTESASPLIDCSPKARTTVRGTHGRSRDRPLGLAQPFDKPPRPGLARPLLIGVAAPTMLYTLRDPLGTYEVGLAADMRRPRLSMQRFDQDWLVSLARSLCRDDANERIVAGLVERSTGRAATGTVLLERFAELVVHGRLVLREVAVPDAYPLPDPYADPPMSLAEMPVNDPLDDGPPRTWPTSEPERTTTWVSFEVVDEQGRRADGEFRLGLDAKVVSGCLGQQAHRYDELREAVRVELFARQLRWAPDDSAEVVARPHCSPAREHVANAPGGRLETLELEPGGHARVVVRRPRLWRIQRSHLRFRPDSALLVPSAATAGHHPLASIMAALHVLDDEFDSALTIVGHADPGEANAEALALARAEGVVALLRDAKDDWVTVAAHHGSLSDIAEYINYLGRERRWSCHMGPPEQAPSDEATAGLIAFQAEFNRRFEAKILEDGVCGRQTLGAVFSVLRYELERWMEKHDVRADAIRLHPDVPHLAAATHVASSAPEMLGEPAPGVARMVDLVLSTPESLLGETPSVDLLYFDGRTAYETLPVEPEPGAWEFGSVVVYLPEDDAARGELRYELKSHQGDYDRILATTDDAVARDGFFEFEFEDVPIASDFRLLAHSGPDTTLLFEGVPYADIETIEPVRSQDIQVPYLAQGDA